jgi:alkaline phosphatase D
MTKRRSASIGAVSGAARAPISRRAFLLAGITAVVAACREGAGTNVGSTSPSTPSTSTPSTTTPTTTAATTTAPTTTAPPTPELPGDPFTLGVASGDPLADSVILWTRLAPAGGGMPDEDVEVTWELANAADFAELLESGTAVASPGHAHAVHVDATNLEPSTTYWYRFRVGSFTSAVGRTVTMPAPDDRAATLTIGHASCQHYETGFYAAHRDIAASQLDAVIWLGDYIYENAARPIGQDGVVRSHDGPETTDLTAYRNRYALYKSDRDLQAAHASAPWFVIWDDHEVQDNYAADHSKDPAVPPAQFQSRRAVAYQAWWEHQPVRLPAPTGADYQIYRSFTLGPLATLFLLDGRQYRTDQACGDAVLNLSPACPDTFAPGRTMLGDTQERWLYDGLGNATTTWNILGNQVMLGDLTLDGAVLNYDQWDGYPEARQRLKTAIDAAGLKNVVAVTGDIHVAFVNNITVDDESGRHNVATELVATSISSDSGFPPGTGAMLPTRFPEIQWANDLKRGWVRSMLTQDEWRAEYRIVDDVTRADSAVGMDRTFRIVPTEPGIAPG